MGFNTTVLVLNDQLEEIRRDPERFVEQLHKAICGANVYVPGGTRVMPTAHADEFRLYATGCNSIHELSPYARDTLALATRSPQMRELVLGLIDQAEDTLRRLRERLAGCAACGRLVDGDVCRHPDCPGRQGA